MIAKCPKCYAEMEGELAIGDLVECPGCHTQFILKGKDIVPKQNACDETVTKTPLDNIGRTRPFHFKGEPKQKSYRSAIMVICAALLTAVVGVLIRNAKSNRAYKRGARIHAKGESVTTHSAPPVTQMEKSETGHAGNTKKRELTKAEKVFKEALDHMSGEVGQPKDVLKAYQGFTKAKDMGYEFAEVALAHLCWTLTDEDIKALEAAGVSSPKQGNGYSWYPYVKPMPEWIARSRLAKFEQGLYQLTLHWKERNEEGLLLIIQAAEEGLPLANSFLKSNFSNTYGLSVSETLPIVCGTLSSGGETLAAYQQLCGFEIMKEYYRSVGALDD